MKYKAKPWEFKKKKPGVIWPVQMDLKATCYYWRINLKVGKLEAIILALKGRK